MNSYLAAAIQMRCNRSPEENLSTALAMIRQAAQKGAKLILLPELFEHWYFCQEKNYDLYSYATSLEENPAVQALRPLAKELGVVLPVSFYEKDGLSLYNTVAVIDADGSILGIYRKTHIPDDHFYQEKFYFTPGNTGFQVWDTAVGRIGVGICWDQWFPEAARCMALMGAQVLLYPTAIGSEPILETDSMPHWQRCMQGHSAANLVPVIAANRVGTETVTPSEDNNHQSSSLTFYGSSFLTDATGKIVSQGSRDQEEILLAEIHPQEDQELRMSWGVFRDRRPEMYGAITK